MAKKRFILIDSNSIIHRAFHAYPPQLSTSEGEQINAVYGFAAILLKVIEDLKPAYLVCVFDTPKPTIRHTKYVGYKATRKPVDVGLKPQFSRIKQVVDAFDIPILEVEGFEADDVIGTLENDLRAKNFEKILVTGDQDMFQLLDSDTKIYLSGRNFRDSKLFSKKDVVAKVGLKPEQIVDFKALYGDPSDNIPGVSGIGKKGAVKLLKKYKSLDGIYKNLEKVETRYKNKLEIGAEDAKLSQELATIMRDVPLSYDLKQCKFGKFDISKVKRLFQELGFRSLQKRLEKLQREKPDLIQVAIKKDVTDGNIKNIVINQKKDLKQILSDLSKEDKFAISIRLSEGKNCTKRPTNIGICFTKGAYCFDSSLLDKSLSKKLSSILESSKIKKIGFDLKEIIHAFDNLDIHVSGIYFDVQIAAYILQGGSGGTGFSELSFNLLGEIYDSQLTLDKVGSGQDDMEARKASSVWRIYEALKPKLDKENTRSKWNCYKLFSQIEMPLVQVLAKMEKRGITLDKSYIEKFANSLDEKIQKIEKDIFDSVGHEFNVASPKQVAEVLFEELNLPSPTRTKSGNYSTSISVLSSLLSAHPVVEHILNFRELSKLRSTYTTTLLDCVDKRTGRIHTTYNQAKTSTGRLSSQDPNLQNIPIAKDLGKKIRKAFIAAEGYSLASFDYSQQELRILAHLAKERELIRAFEKKVDVHSLTASKIFEKDIKKVSKKERSIGKTINFGVMYGMSAQGLSSMLKIPFEKADEFIKKYFEEYSSVKNFFDNYLSEVAEKGYAVTIFGRKRQAPKFMEMNFRAKNAIIRELINFPMQGSAADMMKKAMVEIDKYIEKNYKDKVWMVLQIHDELIFEVSKNVDSKKFSDDVEKMMEKVYDLDVPLDVEVSIGKNLEEVH